MPSSDLSLFSRCKGEKVHHRLHINYQRKLIMPSACSQAKVICHPIFFLCSSIITFLVAFIMRFWYNSLCTHDYFKLLISSFQMHFNKLLFIPLFPLVLFFKNYLFIWLPWVLVEAHKIFTASRGIFHCGAQTLELWCQGSCSYGMQT